MIVRIPARWQVFTASATSGRGGSIIAMSPRNVSPASSCSGERSSCRRARVGDGEHAQPMAAHVVVGLGDARPQGVVERTVDTVDTRRTHRPTSSAGTLRVEHLVTVDPMQRAHPLAARVERQLVDPGRTLACGVEIDPCLASGDFDRGLGRVAEHRPPVILSRPFGRSPTTTRRRGRDTRPQPPHPWAGYESAERRPASLPRGRSRRHRTRTGRRA